MRLENRRGRSKDADRHASLPALRKWNLLLCETKRRGGDQLSLRSPVSAAGSVRAWWNGLSLFWRAQAVGWALFAVIVLVNQHLIYHDFSIDLARTTLIVPCLVLLSVVMRSVYVSPQFGNRLTFRATAWVTLLSVGGASLLSALIRASSALMDRTAS